MGNGGDLCDALPLESDGGGLRIPENTVSVGEDGELQFGVNCRAGFALGKRIRGRASPSLIFALHC